MGWSGLSHHLARQKYNHYAQSWEDDLAEFEKEKLSEALAEMGDETEAGILAKAEEYARDVARKDYERALALGMPESQAEVQGATSHDAALDEFAAAVFPALFFVLVNFLWIPVFVCLYVCLIICTRARKEKKAEGEREEKRVCVCVIFSFLN